MNAAVQLGDLLSLGEASSAELHAWLRAQDPVLAEQLERDAAARSESLARFLRIAVSDFLAEAGEEARTSLMSAVRDAPDPGAACVAQVAAFRVRLECVS